MSDEVAKQDLQGKSQEKRDEKAPGSVSVAEEKTPDKTSDKTESASGKNKKPKRKAEEPFSMGDVFEVDIEDEDTPEEEPEAKEPGEKREVPLLNVPNMLTILRLIMVPIFLVFMYFGADSSKAVMSALFIFILAAITDKIDGQLARKWNMVTNFGKIVDPIADKALVLGAFIALSAFYDLYAWFTILVIFRELSVTLMRIFLLKRNIVLAANMGGKVKTALQMLLVVVLLVGRFINGAAVGGLIGWFAVGLVILTFVITMLTGIDYFIVGIYRYQKLKEAELDAREANFDPGAPIIKADPKKVEEAEAEEELEAWTFDSVEKIAFAEAMRTEPVAPVADEADNKAAPTAAVPVAKTEEEVKPAVPKVPAGSEVKPLKRPRPKPVEGDAPVRKRLAGERPAGEGPAGKRPVKRPVPKGEGAEVRRKAAPRRLGPDGKPLPPTAKKRPRPEGATRPRPEGAGRPEGAARPRPEGVARPRPEGAPRPAASGVSTAKPMPRPANPMQAPKRKRRRVAPEGEAGQKPLRRPAEGAPKRPRPEGSEGASAPKPEQ